MGEYSFENAPDGTPTFTQVLRWSADPNVRSYEVALETAAGEPVLDTRLEEPILRLHLGPGAYRFRIVLYNLLGKPEMELPWRTFTVLMAKQPQVTGVSPKELNLEDVNLKVTMSGHDLERGAKVSLTKADQPTESIAGTIRECNGTSSLRVEFPAWRLAPGRYSVVITNPGGLWIELPEALVVRYQVPMDMAVSAGYSPWVSLYDAWYLQAWPGTFFPLSATARFSSYFIKRPFGYFGAELDLTGLMMRGGTDAASVTSTIGLASVRAIYKYPLSPQFAAGGRIGGGIALSNHQFTYQNGAGPAISSANLFVSTGLFLQYYPMKKLFVETSVDWTHQFMQGFSEGSLMPCLLVGTVF